MTQDQSRAEFEAWARRESPSINLTREGDGYRYSLAEMLYDAWQAARAAASATTQQSLQVDLPEAQCEVEVRSHATYVDHPIYEWRDNLPDGTYKLYTEQQVRALLAAAPQPPQAGWLPIESAPKHDSVLLYAPPAPIYAGRKRLGLLGEPQQDEHAWRCDSSGRFANPTHWMPLPQSPKDQG